MLAFLAKRIAGGILTLFVIGTLCFFIVRFAPGSPFTSERRLPPEVLRNLEHQRGYDKPLPTQYFLALKGYASGYLGFSEKYKKDVADIVLPSFGTSLQLGCLT